MKLLGISTDDLHHPGMASLFMSRLLTLGIGLVLAVTVGYWVGTGERLYLGALIGLVTVSLIFFGMQRKAWILIPLTWVLTGSLSKLPLPFSIRDFGVFLATASYITYRVLSQENLSPKLHILDLFVGLNILYVAFTLWINPVGFAIFGSATIGARPIVNIGIAVAAYWVIIRLPGSVRLASRIPYLMLIPAVFVSGIDTLIFAAPSLGSHFASWYSGFEGSSMMNTFATAEGGDSIHRIFGLRFFGLYLIWLLCAYYSPATLFYPRRGRFYAMLLVFVAILAAGYRNLLLWMMASIGIGGWLHRRWRELALGAMAGAILLAMLLLGQGRLYELPQTMQRALAFLPGKWSDRVVSDTEGSSSWRFTLWKTIVEDGTIKDWWFGDGFGANLEDALATVFTGRNYKDFILLSGAYHSGPLTTIRYAGVFGLLLLYLLSISAAFYSYQCVNECRGSPLFPAAVFFAIQLIWGPIHYTFVFGGYDSYLPDLLFQVGCLRLLFRMSDEMKRAEVTKTRRAPVQIPVGVPA